MRSPDSRRFFKRSTLYAALTVFLVGGYLAVAAALRAGATRLLGHAGEVENVIATALIAVAFVPFRAWVTEAVDRLFFRTRYDFREVVARVTQTAHGTLDIAAMKRLFLDEMASALHPRYMYILTMQASDGLMTAVGAEATHGDLPTVELRVPADDPLLARTARELEMEYVPATGLTGLLSPLAALGPHYRVPLRLGDETVGMVVLGPKRSDEDYSPEDRELIAATRLPLATAIKTAAMLDDRLFKDRMDQELKRAREVQEAMLPRGLPARAGFEFAASSLPCHEASGDYFDFIDLPDGRLGIAVADVAGKGIAAALATAMAKSGIYSQVQIDPEVIPVLTALNRLIHNVSQHASAKSFTTCCYAVLDPASARLSYACAGHFPPLHYDARAGRLTEFPVTSGFPLGVRASAKYVSQEVRLGLGDVLVFYSDGVTEAQAPALVGPGRRGQPGEPFESERLAETVRAHHGASAAEIHAAILAALDRHVAGGPQTDDITLIVLKVASTPSSTTAPSSQESLP